MIHHWLGWISLTMCVLLLAKYMGRIFKNINNSLRKIHEPLGIAVIIIAGLHGIIAFIKAPQETIRNITGLLVFILIVLLAATYYKRAKFKAKWFKIHRYSAVILCILMIIHIVVSV